MAGKKRHHAEEHENLERWLVSYADFITLLFATFVVLYALSQLDLEKFKELKISLQKAFSAQTVLKGDEGILSQSNSILSENASNGKDLVPAIIELEAKYEDSTFNEAKKSLDELEKTKDIEGVETSINERGLIISLIDSLFFSSGSAEVRKNAYPALEKVGRMLKIKFSDHAIRVEGHTDSIPTSSALYPSNWELSSSRASSIIRFFINNFDFHKNRFAAIGYADSKPIASNSLEDGRKKNRRVEIVVLRNKFIKAEPVMSGINQDRLKTIKELEKKQQKMLENYKNNASDAAKNLMQETGQSIKDVLLYEDPYEKESARIAKELKEKEKEKNNANY
ncbi:MAG: flagellar motor protein MotB [bacterium]